MLRGWGKGWVEREFFVPAFVIVKDSLEHPVCEIEVWLDQPRNAVPVLDTSQLAIGSPLAAAFVNFALIHVVIVLRDVLIDNGIAFIIVALANEPTEYSLWLSHSCRGKDSGFVIFAIEVRNILPGY